MSGPPGRGHDGAGLRALVPYLRPHARVLAAVAVVAAVGAAASLAGPLLVREALAAVQEGRPATAAVVALVVVMVAGSLLQGVQQYLLQRTAEGVVLDARLRLVDRVLRLPVAVLDRRRAGDLMSRIGSDTTLLRTVVTNGVVDLVSGAVVAVGAVVLMAVVDPLLLLVVLAAVSVGVVTVVVVARRVRRLSERAQAAVGAMTASVERALGAVRTIRAARAEGREAAVVGAGARGAYEAGLAVARLDAVVTPVSGVAVQLALLSVLGVGGARVASGDIAVGDLVAFVLYLFLLVLPLAQALQAWTAVQTGLGALTRVEEVLALPAEDDAGARRSLPARPGPVALEFRDVRFSYPGADGVAPVEVLRGVDVVVRRGERVALVGPSGAGKSTLVALAERFHDPDGGAVLLDGVDLRDLPRSQVRGRLGYVEQEAPVLAGTLRDNLLMAVPDATDDDLMRVLAAVNLTDLVERAPQGLATEVGDEGVLLSGGERQRLAIARVLLAAPAVLLLDEPTSSLDARNEAALQAAVDAVAADRTLLVVAHRLSTVVGADQIVVLDRGEVVGRGTHAELLDTSPLYRELAAQQLLAPPAPRSEDAGSAPGEGRQEVDHAVGG